ncbi:MAG: ATP-dependent Clp protease ATP-binding subunit, partial [Lachnospiraceae bacterium]|nr:ATP-dependent Clp protease ATP-binding subunit [Lachnospiraceae bacterium]
MVTYETIKKDIFNGEGYGTVLSKIINEPSNKKVIEDSGCVFEALNAAVRALSKNFVPAMEIASPIENFISHTKTNAADVSAADMLFILLVTMPTHELLGTLLVDSGSSVDEVLRLMKKTVSSDLYNTVMRQYNKAKAEIEESEDIDLSSLTDLTAQVASEPVKFIGREDIIDQTILILNRKLKHNVLHVGEPGVGKTACTLGLAQKIVNGDVPDNLKGMKVYSLDVASLIAGSSIRGAMEEALINVLDFVSREPSILYIDEIHTISSGTGSTTGSSMDIASILKPYLSNGGSLRIIGATTNAEYRKRIESDKALARRFQVVLIQEPSVADTIAILKGLKPDFEKYHKVKYSVKVLTEAVELSAKYIRNKFLPDKAIDIIDLAGSKKSLAGEKAVDVSTIRQMVEEMSGMPIGKQVDEGDRLKSLEVNIGNRVFGQDEAVKEIVRCVKLSKAGLNEDNKPIASFLFVGPTG